MVLIPPEAGIQARSLLDSPLQPISPIQGLPSDLLDLQPGQAFSARILQVLPSSTYRALVAGREVTLALPQAANPGDTLELVVMDRSAKAIMAQLAAPPELKPGNAFTAVIQQALPDNIFRALMGDKPLLLRLSDPVNMGEELEMLVTGRSESVVSANILNRLGIPGKSDSYPYTSLSQAAQLIGKLLVAAGDSPEAAPLNGGRPLLTEPPRAGADLTPHLMQAVTQSGLFYESHQAQWVQGKLPAVALQQEPQARLVATSTPPSTSLQPHMIPEELRPLVQQQLDSVTTQRMIWHGEAWPQQSMEWEIQRDAPERSYEAEELPAWSSRLTVTLPHLGRVEAQLRLSGNNLQIALAGANTRAAEDLRSQIPVLTDSLAAAGISVLSLQVRNGD
ncbi:MAG: flagellar hook-length control protein FliK [Proteobacteria bacterium]|nr:flagellar hook-length control protein FliK [Pseudomonadota bacterium]HQR02814.1 flagellar hook-length control protein FliK [Rhodocyclaceae bacterium]